MNAENDETIALAIRLTPAESARYRRIYQRVTSRSPYIRQTDILRELMRLVEPLALTEEEIKYFQTGKEMTDADNN